MSPHVRQADVRHELLAARVQREANGNRASGATSQQAPARRQSRDAKRGVQDCRHASEQGGDKRE
eukprot:13356421-Alexandrium_andersonii.AAC.1